jgi:hypothetical protein
MSLPNLTPSHLLWTNFEDFFITFLKKKRKERKRKAPIMRRKAKRGDF